MGIGIGDVTTVFALLAAMGIVFPGMLLAWSLLFPGMVERSRERVARTPGKTLVFGLIVSFAASIPIGILNALAGPFQFVAYLGGFVWLTLATIGAAGIALMMGERLRGHGVNATTPGGLLRGAIALEFAVVFPVIGWFIVFPIVLLASVGASVLALLHWTPGVKRETSNVTPITPIPTTPQSATAQQ
jgi:hypothetical protein